MITDHAEEILLQEVNAAFDAANAKCVDAMEAIQEERPDWQDVTREAAEAMAQARLALTDLLLSLVAEPAPLPAPPKRRRSFSNWWWRR